MSLVQYLRTLAFCGARMHEHGCGKYLAARGGLRAYRRARRESQALFWARFGVTQSSGSRFEKGMAMPLPIAILLQLFIEGTVSDDDLGMSGQVLRSRVADSLD